MKLMLVDDSELILSELSLLLQQTGKFDRIIKARDGEDAIRQTVSEKPDFVILDLQMPRMDGFTFLRWLMANHPVPVLVFSSAGTDHNIFKAMEIGAVDFITKPDTYMDGEFRSFFLDKIEAALQARIPVPHGQIAGANEAPTATPATTDSSRQQRIIAMAASTGGPTAIQRILEQAQAGLQAPVLVCQHMPKTFTAIFAQRLNMLLELTVKEAEDGEEPLPRHVYVAPGNLHMAISDGRIELRKPEPNDRYTPSADILFETAARSYGSSLLAIVLTGMGNDGTHGLAAVAKAGGQILAESPESCVVYGMPRAAMETGLVHAQLTADQIADRLISPTGSQQAPTP